MKTKKEVVEYWLNKAIEAEGKSKQAKDLRDLPSLIYWEKRYAQYWLTADWYNSGSINLFAP